MDGGGKPIEIEIVYEAKDYWRFYLGYYLSFNNLFFLFLAFATFGILLTFLFLERDVELLRLLDILLIGFLFACLYGFIMSYFSVNSAKGLTSGEYKYIFSDSRVEVIGKSFSGQTDWAFYQSIKESGGYFVLFRKDGQSELIPKRFFQDSEQIGSFKNFLRAKFGDKAYLKKTKETLGLK